MSKDLAGLGDLRFSNNAIDLESPADLYLFSDASPQANGFVAYGHQNGNSNIFFLNQKWHLKKRRSLPVLELLDAHLAIKLIPTLLDAYKRMSINQIFLAVDAQVMLTWL